MSNDHREQDNGTQRSDSGEQLPPGDAGDTASSAASGTPPGAAPSASGPSEKPAILQETEFIVEEGILHRALRTGAIWMNKLFFSSAFLWGVWLLIGYSQGLQDCAGGTDFVGNNSSQELDVVMEGTCSVFLTPTSMYLGAMTVLSFLASITFGILGLVIGKRVIESTRAAEEVGAEEAGQRDDAASGDPQQSDTERP